MIKVVDNDIETLAVALYVKIDDMLGDWPDLAPDRRADGIVPTLSAAELLTMAVMSALLGFTSERRWLRYVNGHLAGMFPRRIGQRRALRRRQAPRRTRRPQRPARLARAEVLATPGPPSPDRRGSTPRPLAHLPG